VAKLAPAALVAALLLATGAAFLYTESLKLETSPIRQTRVTKTFSPVCDCATDRARIAFRLAKPDVLTIWIEDTSGRDVRRLVTNAPRRGHTAFLWNGLNAVDRVVADGFYRARVRLALQEKTIVLPNLIKVDTKPPGVRVVSVTPRVFSPDGDRRADRTAVRYQVDEPASARLRVNGVKRIIGASTELSGSLKWDGKAGRFGLPTGTYRLSLLAVDLAGNRSRPVQAGPVRIRYVELVPHVVRVKAGGALRVRVLTDARRISWRLARRSGRGNPPVLRLRAPLEPGYYRLIVTVGNRHAGATVIVAQP
jgi:hypothetical protein